MLPYDVAALAAEVQRELSEIQQAAGTAFDLRPALTLAQDLVDRARQLSACADARALNRAVLGIIKSITPIDYTAGSPFEHDAAVPARLFRRCSRPPGWRVCRRRRTSTDSCSTNWSENATRSATRCSRHSPTQTKRWCSDHPCTEEAQMRKKAHTGYKSFQYLEPGVDYREFKLAKEIDRVPPYVYPVTPQQEQRVQRILEEHTIVSMHDHSFITPEEVSDIFEYRRWGAISQRTKGWPYRVSTCTLRISWMAPRSSPLAPAEMDGCHSRPGNSPQRLCASGMVYLALTLDDLYRAKQEGKIAFVATLESATAIENEVDRVDVLYGFGVRSMGPSIPKRMVWARVCASRPTAA